ncbi:SEC10/PgrA surface exclusion domain-containing protein [Limosilactobacillus balticus]|uniref:SEC10/PgrA surface exclusion domain-containing protein n=1 Tax=Limosilactobacillus balticus TaxID=2759747 RepID=UPI003992E165
MTKKNTKKTLAMAAAAAAVTGGTMAVTGNVHADTINTQADTQTQTQNPQASDLKTQQDASRQAYADANKANADAQSELAQASAKNTQAQGNVGSAQADVQTATQNVQSATSKEQNTQAEVTQAQAEASKAQSDYDNTVKQQAQTDQAVHQAQSDLKTANQAVSEAQKAADQANAKQSQAQANADTAAQNVKDTTNQVQKVQGEVNDAQTSINNAQNDVKNAENHDQIVAQDQKDITEKTNAKNAADAKVNDAQKVSDEKSEEQSNAQTAVNNAQKTVDQLSKDVHVVNTINASDAYLNQINKERGGMGFIDQNLKPKNMSDNDYQQLVSESKKLNQSNQYQDDPAAEAIPVHMNSNGTLSDEDAKFATQYAAQLLNPLRQKAGSPVYKITNGSLKIAQDVADRYSSDHWNQWEKGHDNAGIEAVGNQWGIGINESWSGDNSFAHQKFVADNPDDILATSGTWVSEYNGLTRNDLQRGIYNAIKAMLFDDMGESFSHATDILGIRETNANKPVEFGVSYEYDTSDHVTNFAGQKNKNAGGFHFNSEFNSNNTNPNGKFFQAEWQKDVAIPKTDDHAAQLASAKKELQDAQAKLETAKQEASQASADLANAKADAQHAADELKAAQDKLAHDQGSSMSLADAQAALKNAKAVLAQKQANLADAQKAAQKAQDMKGQADSALASAKQEAQAAQKTLADAQAKAKSAQERVDALTNGDQAVADAKDKLNAANQKLQVAKSNHETAQENLTKAQNELKQAQTKLENAKDEATKAAQALTDAQTKANSAKDALAKAKAGLITDKAIYGDSVAIKDQTIHASETGKLVDPQIANPMAADPTQNLVMSKFLQMAASKLDTIPTGTTASWNDLNKLNGDANTVGDHSEDVLVTFPDGSTTTVKMNLHVLAAAKPSQPDTPVVNPGHDQPTTPSDPTDQPGHNVKPGDTTKPASKPSTEPSTTPSHEEQQPGTHTDTPTAKPIDQQPSTQPSGNQGQSQTTTPDHKATVNDNSDEIATQNVQTNVTQTAITANGNNDVIKIDANGVENSNNLKRSDLNNGRLPQTGNTDEMGLIGLSLATMASLFGIAGIRRKY